MRQTPDPNSVPILTPPAAIPDFDGKPILLEDGTMNKPVMFSILSRINLSLKDLVLFGDVHVERGAVTKLWFVDQRSEACKNSFFMELNYFILKVL